MQNESPKVRDFLESVRWMATYDKRPDIKFLASSCVGVIESILIENKALMREVEKFMYKPFLSISDDEVYEVFKDLYGIDRIPIIKRNKNSNSIYVKLQVEVSDFHGDFMLESGVEMRSDDFDEPEFAKVVDAQERYRRYMVHHGYSKLCMKTL